MDSIANRGIVITSREYNIKGELVTHLGIVADCTECIPTDLLAVGVVAYVLSEWGETKAISTIFEEYYSACKEQYTLEHHKDPDAWRRDLNEEFYSIHIEQEREKINSSNGIHELAGDDSERLSNYANEYLEYAKRRIKKERGQRDNMIETPLQQKQQEGERGMPPETNNVLSDRLRTVLGRGVDTGLLSSDFQPIKGRMTKGQMKIFAICAGIECGLQHYFKTFETLWNTKNLAQVREYEMKPCRIKEIELLFPSEVVESYKRKG